MTVNIFYSNRCSSSQEKTDKISSTVLSRAMRRSTRTGVVV